MKIKIVKIPKEIALTLWHKNLNLTRELTGRVNRALALQFTHNDLEALKARSVSPQDLIVKAQ